MFPLRDDQPRRTRPWITLALIAMNVLVFLYQFGLDEHAMFELLARAALFPARLSAALTGDSPIEALDAAGTLVTSQFLHGGLFHLVVNLWALWIFGDNVEERLGPLRYLAFYVLCGASAGLLHVAWQPDSRIPTVGASGAIAGVMGAYVVMFPRARVLTLFPILFYPVFLNLPAVVYLGLWFVLQLSSGLLEPADATRGGGVAWWAHIGGFAAGIALAPLLGSRRRRAD